MDVLIPLIITFKRLNDMLLLLGAMVSINNSISSLYIQNFLLNNSPNLQGHTIILYVHLAFSPATTGMPISDYIIVWITYKLKLCYVYCVLCRVRKSIRVQFASTKLTTTVLFRHSLINNLALQKNLLISIPSAKTLFRDLNMIEVIYGPGNNLIFFFYFPFSK